MKKLLVTSLMSLTAALAFGQGTVYFDNSALTSPPDRLIRFKDATTPGNVFGTANAPAVGTNFYVSLWYKGGTVTDDSLLSMATKTSQSKLRASTTTAPGTWSSAGSATLDGVPFGAGAVTLQVRAWDVLKGATYDASAAAGGVVGKSALFAYTMPGQADPPAAFNMVNFNGFTIQAVPEPSTFALAGLGAAAMLIFRRRK